MRRIYMVVIIGAAIIALLTAEIVIVKSVSNFEPKISIVFAKRYIPEKEEIKPDMVELKEVSLSYAHHLSIKKLEDVIGKTAKVPLESGEMVLTSKLGAGDEIPDIKLVNKNNRLFTVEFKPDQANGWWLITDQYVDIIYVPNELQAAVSIDPSMPRNQMRVDNKIFDKSKVRRLDNIRIAAIIDEKGNLLPNIKRDVVPRYISFEVSSEQDEILAYAKSNGRLEVSVKPLK